jgi:site-specific DNA-methyltransferase (adenine-specific)
VEAEPELAKNWQRNQSQSALEGRNAMNGGLNTIDLRGYAPAGRWPANFCHDGSDEVVGLFPATGASKSAPRGNLGKSPFSGIDGSGRDNTNEVRGHDDNGGSAARFFYCAKASKRDRDEGCEGLEASDKYGPAGQWGSHDCFSGKSGDEAWKAKHPNLPSRNHHPTVKPTDLMAYLCRLITPPSGLILDPFMGSGSTGKAAVREGFRFIGIEQSEEYCEIALARIKHEIEKKKSNKTLFD